MGLNEWAQRRRDQRQAWAAEMEAKYAAEDAAKGQQWTSGAPGSQPQRSGGGIRPAAVWFCLALGAGAFFLLANLGVSANDYSCGTVMDPTEYSGRSAYDFDPTGELGSAYSNAAESANSLKAAEQNFACDDAVGSRKTLAIVAGLGVFALSFGGMKLFRDGIGA